MLWYYERQHECLQIEARYDSTAEEFVVSVRWPDGREQIKRFATIDRVQAWLRTFDDAMDAERWHGSAPLVLPSDWSNKRFT